MVTDWGEQHLVCVQLDMQPCMLTVTLRAWAGGPSDFSGPGTLTSPDPLRRPDPHPHHSSSTVDLRLLHLSASL